MVPRLNLTLVYIFSSIYLAGSITESYSLASMRLTEDLIIKNSTKLLNTPQTVYNLLKDSSRKVKRKLRKSRNLVRKRIKNATENVVANLKQLIVPKYQYDELNMSALLERDINPLLVFVNKKSGGQQGSLILAKFKEILSEYQICDLSSDKPKTYIQLYKSLPSSRLRVLCCGGDGSIQWIMNEFYDAHLLNATFSIMPLGEPLPLSSRDTSHPHLTL